MITLRKYFLWSSHWFCDFNYYNLLFEDIKITNYLQSIFSSLKYPTSNFIIKRYIYKIIIQSTFYILFWFKKTLNRNKLSYYFRKHKRYLINHFLLRKSTYFFLKKISNKIYFFLFRYKKYKMNFTKFFNINIPTINFKKMSFYKIFSEFSNSNRFLFNKLCNLHNILDIILRDKNVYNLKKLNVNINNVNRLFYNLVNSYVNKFFKKIYWSSKLHNYVSNNSIIYNRIKKLIKATKYQNIYTSYFINKKWNLSTINKANLKKLYLYYYNGNMKLKKMYNNFHSFNHFTNIIENSGFLHSKINIYDYSLAYLFNNSSNNPSLLNIFKQEKYFLIYIFLITNNYITNDYYYRFNYFHYFSWYFYSHKYYLQFYNKLHYCIIDEKINYKLFRIYYYYTLLGYRINKLSNFIGTFIVKKDGYIKKKSIDLLLSTDLFFNRINGSNMCQSNIIINKYNLSFSSILGLINYTKKLYNKHINNIESKKVNNKNILFHIKKKRFLYKKSSSIRKIHFLGMNSVIKKYNFYTNKKSILEKKLIIFLRKKKLIQSDDLLNNKGKYLIFSGKNMTIGNKILFIDNNPFINNLRKNILRLNDKIYSLKIIKKGNIDINNHKYFDKIKFISTYWDKKFSHNTKKSLVWSDWYNHYFYYTNRIHLIKYWFNIRMTSNNIINNKYSRINKNIFSEKKSFIYKKSKKFYSTLLYRRKRRSFSKRLLKRSKNASLYLLSASYDYLKKKSKFSNYYYNNYVPNDYNFNIYNSYKYFSNFLYKKLSNSKNITSLKQLINIVRNDIFLNFKSTNITDINSVYKINNIYSYYLIYNILSKTKSHFIYDHIFFNKYIFYRRWTQIKCINSIIGNNLISQNTNLLLLNILKKTLYYIYNIMFSLVQTNKLYVLSSSIKKNYFSKILWFLFVINNLNILSNINESTILQNVVILCNSHLSNSALNNHLLSIFYILRKSVFFSYVNKVTHEYAHNKINNKFLVIKKNMNNFYRRYKYKFCNIRSNNNFFFNDYIHNLFCYNHSNNLLHRSRLSYKNIMNVHFINCHKTNKLFNLINKSFLQLNWVWYTTFSDLIVTVFKIIKYYCYIYLKNNFLWSISTNFLKFIFYSISTVLSYSNAVFKSISIFYSHYYSYFLKVLNIDYVNLFLSKSLLQNKSYYSYYTKYYLLNFLYLLYSIEISIGEYTKTNCFLFMNYSLRSKYYSNSAKMWCEFIAYYLRKKLSIWKLFSLIKKQQRIEKNMISYDLSSDKKDNVFLQSYRYPLKGIRITYSGNLKKAKRKRKLYYYVWLSDSRYTGKMPLKKFKFYIDYYCISVPLKRSSIGIKIWLLFDIH